VNDSVTGFGPGSAAEGNTRREVTVKITPIKIAKTWVLSCWIDRDIWKNRIITT